MNKTKYAVVSALTLLSGSIMANQSLPAIPEQSIKVYAGYDKESLQYNILNSKDFYKPISYLGHYLGFGWAGGTGSRYIGEDMVVERVNEDTYSIYAPYDKNDPYADGYWAHKRLKVKVKDIKLVSNPADLKLKEVQVYDLEPVSNLGGYAYNCGETEDSVPVSIAYSDTRSWSKTDATTLSTKVAIENTHKVGLPFIGGAETKITVEAGVNHTWENVKSGSETIQQTAQYNAVLSPMSKRYISLTVFKQKADIPYELFSYLKYSTEFNGFLRWSGNAHKDHPTNRPTVTHQFGSADGLSSSQKILDEYDHAHIPGYSTWDWNWMKNEFGQSGLTWVLANVANRKYGGILTGKFTTSHSGNFELVGGLEEDLTAQDIAQQCRKSSPRDLNAEFTQVTPSSDIGFVVIDRDGEDLNMSVRIEEPVSM